MLQLDGWNNKMLYETADCLQLIGKNLSNDNKTDLY